MQLLFVFPCLLTVLVFMAGSSNSAVSNDCSYVDCDAINFKLPHGIEGGYCECVNGTGQYFICGDGKTFFVRKMACAEGPSTTPRPE
uniref:Putative 7.8-9.7 kDa secreted peptide n=1 Tax=Psorophora albipes TaxID=869069 RepID=T1E2T1_9DIPT